jgi:hypothetical protein
VKEDKEPSRKPRAGLFIVFVIAYITTILSLYITFNRVGNDVVEGVQGRYFTTVMPLLFLAVTCLPVSKRIHPSAFFSALLAGMSLFVYIVGMYLSYHVPCGSQYYETGLCYQPNYKNWAPNDLYSAPISNQLTLKQEIIPECNGLTELRVWVNATGANPNEKTAFVLRDASQPRDMADVLVSNSELPEGSWYTLNFQADWESAGKLYMLIIQGEQSGNIGPRIAYSLRQEYPAGKLYENEEPINRDMIFQTGCIAGWERTGFVGLP